MAHTARADAQAATKAAKEVEKRARRELAAKLVNQEPWFTRDVARKIVTRHSFWFGVAIITSVAAIVKYGL